MIFLEIFLISVFIIWLRRALLMLGSIKRYSLMPIRAWETNQNKDKVSLIIPCRNEARNLPILMPSLLEQDYPNLEIIFIDDRSTDDTYKILEGYKDKDPRIIVIKGKELPEGWTGKNHAMHQASQIATGKWLLFTDADTEHMKFSVSSSIRYAEEKKLDLLTLTAKCVCKSFGEHLIQPMGIGCFSVWFKLDKVNDPHSSTPLCCGQYLLIKKETYLASGGSEKIKSSVTEDLALFKEVKSNGHTCELAIGGHIFATRMYQSFEEAWIGWRRIYLHALDKNIPSIVSKLLMLIFFSFAPFAILLFTGIDLFINKNSSSLLTFTTALSLCGFILFLRSRSHVALKAAQWSIILHPLSALVICGILIDCLRHHFMGKKVEWKAQHY